MQAINQLDQAWQQWIQENINQQVPYKKIAHKLFEKGFHHAAFEILAQQSEVLDKPYIDITRNHIELPDRSIQLLCTYYSPFVAVIDSFLSSDECEQLIESSKGSLKESRVVSPDDGSLSTHHARTSTSCSFQRSATDLITLIERRIEALLHWPTIHGEGLQILRYTKDAEYRPHYDFFDTKDEGYRKIIGKGGQRVGTLLMYLSDLEAGGGTRFPKINLEVRPKKGMALYFSNVTYDGAIEPLSLHAGLPVISGTKYLATKWLRQNPHVI